MANLGDRLDRYGKWALVAGSAEGLGHAFSDILGASGMNLIMVDNNRTLLHEVARKLAARHRVEVRIVEKDLSEADAADVVMREVNLKTCRLIVCNAAYGPVRPFGANSADQLDFYVDLNCRTPLHLARQFAEMYGNGPGAGFLMMSSMAGLRGTQLVSPYAASKAFVWNLAESLHYEYRARNVDFTASCPGPIATPNYLNTRPEKTLFGPSPRAPEFVARKSLEALGRSAVYIPGTAEKISHFVLSRLVPRKLAGRLMNDVIVKMYGKSEH